MNAFIGQFHPLLVHLPIGFLVLAVVFRVLSIKIIPGITREILALMVLASFLAAVFSSVSGLLLANEGGYNNELINKHRLSGLILTGLTLILYLLLKRNGKAVWQNSLWIITAVFLGLTGHWGGNLTHGEDYFGLASTEYQKPEITDIQQAIVYRDIIEPIFAEKCWSCHSAKKQKGELRLDGEEWITKGGESGEVLVAHQAAESDLYSRLLLEKDHEDHMPPDGKPQLTAQEITLIEWWINSGVPFDRKVSELKQTEAVKRALSSLNKPAETPVPLPDVEVRKPDAESLEKVQKSGFALTPVAQNSSFLSLSLTGKTLTAEDWEVFRPFASQLVWFRSGSQSITAKAFSVISSFENLTVLDLSGSKFDPIEPDFSTLTHLTRLNLSTTDISFSSLEKLHSLTNLRQLYLFNTNLNAAEKEKLKSLLKNVYCDFGGYQVPALPGDTTTFTKDDLET